MATCRWIGNAVNVTQITSITVQDTWAPGDTAVLTINGNDLVVTVGTDDTPADVAAALAAAVNATSRDDGLVGDESRNIGGQEIPELREVTADAIGDDLILTGRTPGKPFEVTVSETTAGDGTLGSPVDLQSATGRNWFSNAANWSTGTVPADADDIVFDAGDVDCIYGIDQSAITPASITIKPGYTGRIGLPLYNTDDQSNPYREYRPTYLALGNSTDAQAVVVTIDSTSNRIKLDTGTAQTVWRVLNTGTTREDTNTPCCLLKGTHTDNTIDHVRGDVSIAFYADETATVDVASIGYRESREGDAQLILGEGVTLDAIEQSGGNITTASNVATLNMTGGTCRHVAGTMGTANLDGGTLLYDSTGTLTTVRVGNGGVLDFRQATGAVTVTNCELHSGASYYDPAGRATITNGWDFVRCTPGMLQAFEIKPHQTLTASAI